MKNKKVITVGYGKVNKVFIGDNHPLVFILGPCAIESRDHAFLMAELISDICNKTGVPWIYKSCYDKDCRSSPSSFHGIGIDQGLKILSGIRDNFNVPVVADFSNSSWAAKNRVNLRYGSSACFFVQTDINSKSCSKYKKTYSFKERAIYESLESEKFCKKDKCRGQ